MQRGTGGVRRALFVVVSATVLGAMIHAAAVAALVVPTMVGAIVLVLVFRLMFPPGDEDQARRRVFTWTLFALAAHLLAGLIIQNTSLYLYLGADAYMYDLGANDIVEHWTRGAPMPDYIPDGKSGYYYVLAGVYWLFGSFTAGGLALNATLAAALVPVTTDLTRRLFGWSAARYVPPLVVLLPGLFLWTSQLLKEAPIVLLIAVAANAAVRLTERPSPASLLALALSLATIFSFRAWVGLVVAAGIVGALPLCSRPVFRGLGTAFSALMVVAAVVALGFGYSGYKAASEADLQQAQIVRQGLALGGDSGFAPDVDVSTTRGAISYLPQGIVRFTLGPFPWELTDSRQLPALVDAFTWWLLLPSLWRGWRASSRLVGRRNLILVLPAVAVTVMLSLAVGNFGTVVRERQQVVILLLPLFALGLAERRAGKHRVPERAAAFA